MTATPPQHRDATTDTTDATATVNTRRRFLAATGAIGLLLINRTASAARPVGPDRRVFLLHPYTSEEFRDVYWTEGRYRPEALWRINSLLRDHSADRIIGVDPQLIDVMVRLNARLGRSPDDPVEVISGYRSAETNAKARKINRSVARNSFHMQGKAVDIRVKNVGLSQLRKAALTLEAGGVGTYPRRNYLHIDVGPVRTWGR